MASPQIPQRPRITPKAFPCVIFFNLVNHFAREIARYATLAKYVRTIGATVNFASLAAPATIQLAAIFALIEFAAVVKRIALLALRGAQNGMHLDG